MGFVDFASGKLAEFFPGYDQPALNDYFGGVIERLPAEINWRPYWGYNPGALFALDPWLR